MSKLSGWIVSWPRVVLAGFGVTTVVLTAIALQIRIESSIESTLPSGSPDVDFYEDVREIFGSDEIGVVGVRSEDLFSKGTLEKIRRLTSALEKIGGVDRVVSLTNAVDPSRDVFSPPPLILTIPPSASQRAELERTLTDTPLFAINLVSKDLHGAAINIFFEDLSDAEYADLGIDAQVRTIIAAEEGPEQIYYTGASHVKHEATASMRRDLYVFTPIALCLVLATLWVSFRRLRAVVAPMVTVVAALVWTLAVMVLAEKSINLGTFVLPPLLLVIGSSYAIHVLSLYYERCAVEADHARAVRDTIEQVCLPLAISAGTTIVGFGALAMNRITAIRELGAFAAVGIALLVVACLVLLPAMLAAWGVSDRASEELPETGKRLREALARVGGLAHGSRWSVLTTAVILTGVALIGLHYVRIDSDFLGYFDPESQVRRDNQAINDGVVGSSPFYLVVDSDNRKPMEQWTVLKEIRDLQVFLSTLPGVAGSISLVDYLELMERGSQSGDEDFTIDEDGNLVPFERPDRSAMPGTPGPGPRAACGR